jgi:hypothetical protein
MGISKTQGTDLSVETARAAAKVISGITQALPAVVTSNGHGYANGDVVTLSSIVGMVQMNDRAVVVANVTTNSFECAGVDTTGYSTYVSGGSAYKVTETSVGTVTAIPQLFTGTAAEIDTTHLKSVAKEKIQGLEDFGDATIDILLDNNDVGQAKLRSAKALQQNLVFMITLTDGTRSVFVAFVKSFSPAIAANEVNRATVGLTLKAAPSWFV